MPQSEAMGDEARDSELIDTEGEASSDKVQVATHANVRAELDAGAELHVGDHSLQIGPTDASALYEGHWRRGNRSGWGEKTLIFEVVELGPDLLAIYVRELSGESPDTISFEHTVVLIGVDGLSLAWTGRTDAFGSRLSFPGDGTAFDDESGTRLCLDPSQTKLVSEGCS